MENKIILIDTSILIEFFRKTDKANSTLLSLVKKGYKFKISAITVYEIYVGANENRKNKRSLNPFKIDFISICDFL